MPFEKLIELLIFKRKDLVNRICVLKEKLESCESELDKQYFWCRGKIHRKEGEVMTIRNFLDDSTARLRAVDRLWQTLACGQNIISSLSDTMVVLSMFIDDLSDEEILQTFGAVAVRSNATNFLNIFDVCGRVVSYIDESSFRENVDVQLEWINPKYQLNQSLDAIKACLARAVRASNCRLFDSLTFEEKAEVDAYLSPNSNIICSESSLDVFDRFCQSVYECLQAPYDENLASQRTASFLEFKDSFMVDTDAVTKSTLSRDRRQNVITK